MKVLLVNPPLDLAEFLFSTPPCSVLGPLYSAAVLRADFEVALADSFLLPGALPAKGAGQGTGRARLGGSYEELLREIEGRHRELDAVVIHKARFFGHKARPELAAFLAGLKARYPGALLLLADLFLGDLYLPPYQPLDYLRQYPLLDGVLHGAGEGALSTLFKSPKPLWNRVPGWSFRGADGTLVDGGFHYDQDPGDLDLIPAPAYDLLGTERYARFFQEAEALDLVQESHDGLPMLALMATRGCNHGCFFCSMPDYKIRWRRHSLEYLERTLGALAAAGGVGKFVFTDPVLNSDGPHFKALLRLLVDRGYRFHIPNGLRATALDDEVLDLMKAGSAALITSMETPDCDLLRLHINKGILPDEVTSLARRCYSKKLPLKIHYVIGMPGETVRQVNATLAFAAYLFDNFGAQPLVQIATPIPGTQMQREASAAGQLTLPLEDIAAQLPVLFQARSVISTPGLPAETVTAMQGRFQRYVVAEHPLELTVVPGYGCNNHCHHCMVRGLEAPGRSLEAHLEAVQDAVSRGVRTLVVEGGEPTLYAQLFELVRGAREAGMSEVMVETNGRRCAYLPYARGLLDAGVTMLFVTFQGGNPGDHDRVTRAPGSFQQGVQGLTNLLACGFENLAVNLSLHRHLLVGDGLAAAVEGFAGLGVRRFMLQYPTPFGAFGGQARTLPRYEEVAGPLVALFARFPQLELKVMNLPFCALPGHEAHIHPDLNNLGRLPLDGDRDEAIVTLLACGRVKDGRCEACSYGFLCTGFLEGKLGAGGGPGEEDLVSNSLDFVEQGRLPGFAPRAVGCEGAGLALGDKALRQVLLLGDGGATVYGTETGDFSAEELAELKHEAQQLFLDVSGKVALDDFQADLRQLRLAAECRDCGLRRGCATAWTVDPALPFGAQESWLQGQLGGLRGRVLDLGCGELRYRDLVGELVGTGAVEYHGVEPDGAALERLRAAGIPMTLTQGTLEEYQAPAASFDAVLLLRSVHHLPRLAEAFAKIAALLKPGGTVILADGLPLALLRSQEAARAARESLAPHFEHYRNWGSQQLLEFLAPLGLPLEVEEHHPITPATGNLWLLRLRRM